MARITPFILAPPGRPSRRATLDAAERAFLLAIRWWVAGIRHGEDPELRPGQQLHTAGARNAFSVDALKAIVARFATLPVAIRCPQRPHPSPDETHLIHAAGQVRAGESAQAERALRTALLSASGAEFALDPLEGLSELFARTRLLFGRRRSPADALWTPSIPSPTVH
jgi:hypothetical protein